MIALAEAVDAASRACEPEVQAQLAEHAQEEAEHVGALGRLRERPGRRPRPRPRAETVACRESWTAGRDALENLVAAFTIESGQPAISRTKLDGLVEHYGFEEGPATEYFSLHAELDHEHAAQSRELIEERLADADLDRLLEVAEGALRGQLEAARRLRPGRPGRVASRGRPAPPATFWTWRVFHSGYAGPTRDRMVRGPRASRTPIPSVSPEGGVV